MRLFNKNSLQWQLLLILAVPSILLFIFLTPTWNFIDTQVIMLGAPKHMTPHWPPLYMLFMQNVHDLFSNPSSWIANFNSLPRTITDRGIYAVLIIQHLIFICSLYYFLTAISSKFRIQILVLPLILLQLTLFLYVHGIQSEALMVSWLFLILGAAIRLLKCERILYPTICYSLGLFLAILTRHIGLTLAPIAPLALFILLLARKPKVFKTFVSVSLATLVAVVAAKGTIVGACNFWGVESTPIYGRSGVYRMYDAWNSSSVEEQAKILANLQRSARSDLVRTFVPIALNVTDPWVGSYNAARIHILNHPRAANNWTPDKLLNQLFFLYLRNPDKPLLRSIVKTLKSYLTWTIGECTNFVARNVSRSIELYNSEQSKPSFANARVVDPINKEVFQSLADSYYVNSFLRNIRSPALFGLAFLILLFSYFNGTSKVQDWAYAISLLVVAGTQLLLLSVMSTEVFRYTLVTDILSIGLLTYLVAAVAAPRFEFVTNQTPNALQVPP